MLQETVERFGADVFAPKADEWDENKVFPKEELRQASALGLGGVFVSSDFGGSELGRKDGTIIFEALSAGCTSFIFLRRSFFRRAKPPPHVDLFRHVDRRVFKHSQHVRLDARHFWIRRT